MDEDGPNLREFVEFDGELAREDRCQPARFGVRVGDDGELIFRFAVIPLGNDTRWIKSRQSPRATGVPYYRLTGSSNDGLTFSSDYLYFSRLGETLYFEDDKPDTLEPEARCSAATISREVGSVAAPVLQWSLRDLECHGPISADTPLGRLTAAGRTPLPPCSEMTGVLQLRAPNDLTDVALWRREADILLEHVRQILSFAAGHSLDAPLVQCWFGTTWRLDALSRADAQRGGLAVFHPLNLQPILDVAVRSFFAPPVAVKRLFFALEWTTMAAGHTEVRLLNAMTALENLLDANLGKAESLILPRRRFDKLAETLRETIRTQLGGNAAGGALAAKLPELNRRSLHEKVALLTSRWTVPLGGSAPEEIDRAIKARNYIVHRGHYYGDSVPPSLQERDLWDHVIVVREIITRIVLTVLGYRGDYISFRGGYHFTPFPPLEELPSKNADGLPDPLEGASEERS